MPRRRTQVTDEEKAKIKRLALDPEMTQRIIAIRFQLHYRTVNEILTGHTRNLRPSGKSKGQSKPK